jgi:hypothetical protein
LNLLSRQRRRIDQVATGQPHRSLVNGREEKQHQEAAGEEANAAHISDSIIRLHSQKSDGK